jgi:formate dehydrogenase subunit gamma
MSEPGSHLTPVAQPRGGPSARLLRFVLAERLAHWAYAGSFLVALVSGLLMWVPRTRVLLGVDRLQFSHVHAGFGVLMVLGPLAIFSVLDRRRLRHDIHEVDVWDEDDRRWFWAALRGGTLRRRPARAGRVMPPQGRFNAGQKSMSVLVAALALGFLVSGSLLLLRLHLPASVVSRALYLHIILVVVSVVLLLGHLAHVFLTGHGRDSLTAMIRGTLSEDTAQERYRKWWQSENE